MSDAPHASAAMDLVAVELMLELLERTETDPARTARRRQRVDRAIAAAGRAGERRSPGRAGPAYAGMAEAFGTISEAMERVSAHAEFLAVESSDPVIEQAPR